jgi:FMN-dependent NADH-azoreductase
MKLRNWQLKELFGKICKYRDLHSRLYLDSKDMKNKFIDYLKEEIIIAYGNEPEKSPDFARIVNVKNWNRLTAMIDDDKVILVVSLMNLTVTSPYLLMNMILIVS